jgi:hypothetical protein
LALRGSTRESPTKESGAPDISAARRAINTGCNLDANYRHRPNQSRNKRITIPRTCPCLRFRQQFRRAERCHRQPQGSSLIFPAISGGIRWYQPPRRSRRARFRFAVNESIRANLANSRTSRLIRAIAGRSIRGCLFSIERTDERTLPALAATVGSQF